MFYSSVRHHCKLNSVPLVWGTKWAPHPNKFLPAEQELLSHLAELLCPPVPLRVLLICNPPAAHPKMPRNYVEQLLCLACRDSFASWTCKSSQVCDSAATQHRQISGVSLRTSGLGYCSKLHSCVIQWEICQWWAGTELFLSPVNAPRCLQSLLDCFPFWQYGKSNFSPPVLHALTCKSQPEHWHLQAGVRAFQVFFTS